MISNLLIVLVPQIEQTHYPDDLIMPLIPTMMNWWWPSLNTCLCHQTHQQSNYKCSPSGPEPYVLIPQVQRALMIPYGMLRLQCESRTLTMTI